jgi:chromosomal replication initiation ATPase DnaA
MKGNVIIENFDPRVQELTTQIINYFDVDQEKKEETRKRLLWFTKHHLQPQLPAGTATVAENPRDLKQRIKFLEDYINTLKMPHRVDPPVVFDENYVLFIREKLTEAKSLGMKARYVIHKYQRGNKVELTPKLFQEALEVMSRVSGVSKEAITGKSKKGEVVRARVWFVIAIRTAYRVLQRDLGELIGRDHTDITHYEMKYKL